VIERAAAPGVAHSHAQTIFRVHSPGTGIHDLAAFLRCAGLRQADDNKPLSVFLTHAHFDHSGGLHHFVGASNVSFWAHPVEASWASSASPLHTAAWIEDQEVQMTEIIKDLITLISCSCH